MAERGGRDGLKGDALPHCARSSRPGNRNDSRCARSLRRLVRESSDQNACRL